MLLTGAEHVVEESRFGPVTHVETVKELIQQMSRGGTDSTVFHIVTYDRLVLEAAATLNELAIGRRPIVMMTICSRAGNDLPALFLLQPIIRRFLSNHHIMHVRFAQARRSHAQEPGLFLKLFDRVTAGVTHA